VKAVNPASLVLTAAAGACLVLVCAAQAGAADVTDPTVTSQDGMQVMHLLAESSGAMFIPKGGEPSHHFPDGSGKGPNPGDAFSFTENLKQDGAKVGSDKGGCTFAAPTDPLHCIVTLTFPRGTIGVEGDVADGKPNTLKLTGGTGAYAGIAGTALVKDIDDDHTDLTLRYTTGGGGATQVAAVPVGGAGTGGGSTAQGGVGALVGLGAVVAAAGAGLIGSGLSGFGRRTGRREG
jgi:hypothetical protein